MMMWLFYSKVRTVSATSGVGQGKTALGVDHADHSQEGHCCQVRVLAHLCEFGKNINNNLIFLTAINNNSTCFTLKRLSQR